MVKTKIADIYEFRKPKYKIKFCRSTGDFEYSDKHKNTAAYIGTYSGSRLNCGTIIAKDSLKVRSVYYTKLKYYVCVCVCVVYIRICVLYYGHTI